jgi:hypothetical protein
MKGKFKVIFDGFETLAQAQSFADWYVNDAEGVNPIFYEKNEDKLIFVEANHSHADEETREIIIPLNLYKK